MIENSGKKRKPFKVKISSTGDVLDIPEDKSILNVLLDNGYVVDSSCIAGVCGLCRVRYLDGEVDHKDYVLTDQERSEYLTACTSRSLSSQIVLDLPAAGTVPSHVLDIEAIMKACPKLLMNGPCGGSENGKCEVDTSIPCVWATSWQNARKFGLLDKLKEVQPPRDWSANRGIPAAKGRPEARQPSNTGVPDNTNTASAKQAG